MSLGCVRCYPDGRRWAATEPCSCLRVCGGVACTGYPWTAAERVRYMGLVPVTGGRFSTLAGTTRGTA